MPSRQRLHLHLGTSGRNQMTLTGMYGFTQDEMEPYFYCVCALRAPCVAFDLSFLRCACHAALLDRLLD